MVKLSKMRWRQSFTSSQNVCVDLIQRFVSPSFSVHILVEFGMDRLDVGVVEIPHNNKNALRVSVLLPVDSIM